MTAPSSPNHSPRLRLGALIPWAFVAVLAIVCAWLLQLTFALRAANTLLHQQQALTEIELRSTQQHLEAERILHRHSAASKATTDTPPPSP